MAEQKYIQAEQVIESIYNEAKKKDFVDWTTSIEPTLAEIYHLRGKLTKAYELMQQYAARQDKVLKQQKSQSVTNWMKSRIAEKDKQLLKKQLFISIQNKQLQRKNFWMGSIAFFCVVLSFALVSFIRSYRHKQKLQQGAMEQLRQMQQIDHLKAQVRGEEQERNRIATELHDSIASQIWAIKLNLDEVLKGTETHSEQKQSLQTIYGHLDEVAQEVRETAHNLMPALLLEEGLTKAMAALCERIEKSTSLDVEFQEYGTIPALDIEIQLSIYRMIQELIQNVLKHAHATALLVQVSCVDTLLNVTIEDNGSGLATLENKNEFGLRNIQRRVDALQGQFDLKSAPGSGTTIYIEFDIRYFPETHVAEASIDLI